MATSTSTLSILILTQYFPPEVGAPQNRLYELAVRLMKHGANIDVLTAMPNYPQMVIHQTYRGKMYVKEEMSGMDVFRSYIYVSRSSGIFSRLMNYFSFVITSFITGILKTGRYDYIFCESPPLFLGISAILLKKLKRTKLIFNVADLWPESAEKLGIINNKLLLKISTKLELLCYNQSSLITGQHKGIVKNISARTNGKPVHWLPNGVDLEFFNPNIYHKGWRISHGFSEMDFLMGYGGILGHAQGLEVIIKAANLLKDLTVVKFIILGSGPEKKKLLDLNSELENSNVYFFETIPKDDMPIFLKSMDCSIIPLRNIEFFKGVVPSKIFENMAMEKPILLGVRGEAEELVVGEGKAGLAFEPESPEELKSKILELYENNDLNMELGKNGRSYVEKAFNRTDIAVGFYEILQNINNEKTSS